MSLVLVHTGQTGVERGALRAANAAGVPIRGFCSHDSTDELGVLPEEVIGGLKPWRVKGACAALLASIALADAVIVIVPRCQDANAHISVERICGVANRKRIAVMIIDPEVATDNVEAFFAARER